MVYKSNKWINRGIRLSCYFASFFDPWTVEIPFSLVFLSFFLFFLICPNFMLVWKTSEHFPQGSELIIFSTANKKIVKTTEIKSWVYAESGFSINLSRISKISTYPDKTAIYLILVFFILGISQILLKAITGHVHDLSHYRKIYTPTFIMIGLFRDIFFYSLPLKSIELSFLPKNLNFENIKSFFPDKPLLMRIFVLF